MAKPRVLVLRAAGVNCDEETVFAWEQAGAVAERLHVRRLIERPDLLQGFQALTVPGGFSYGDDIASGKVLAMQLVTHLGWPLRDFVDRGGSVLGICNGFQVLVKAGLLPGAGLPAVTLTGNDSGRFEARWIELEARRCQCPYLEPGERFFLPIAHGEGKLVLGAPGGETAISALERAGCVALKYVPPRHMSINEGVFNPNGSEFDIAGLCDQTGRVLGLMPHPERHVLSTQRPDWTRAGNADIDGLRLFRRIVSLLR